MSRGNWRILVALAGLATVAVALGTGAYFGALNAPHYGYQGGRAAYRSPQPEKSNPSQVDRDRAGLPYFAERIASAPDPQDADEREKRDLAAQEASALWAFWLLLVSVAGVVATVIGTGFLLWQIMLTREAVTDTGKATNAMERQNSLASAAQRAWLVIEPKIIEAGIEGNRLTLNWKCGFTNKGETIAKNVKYAANSKLIGEGAFDAIPDEYSIIEKKFSARAFNIIPGENVWYGGGLMQSIKHIKWTGTKPFIHILFIAVAHYQVEGDDDWHTTARTFAVSMKDEDFAFRRAIYQENLTRFTMANVEAVPFGQSVST